MAGSLVALCAGGLAGLAGQFVNFCRIENSPFFENLLLFRSQGVATDRSCPLKSFCLAAGKLLDLFGDAHAAPVVTTHGTEVGIHIEILVVECTGGIRIEGEIKVLLPVECGARLGQLVVAVAGAGNSQSDIRGMGRDLVGDAALLDGTEEGGLGLLLGLLLLC